MPRFVCSLQGKFFEFSTVVEAPVTALMDRAEFEEYYTNTYGELARDNPGEDGMKSRMDRAERTGTSDLRWGENTRPMEDWLRSETLNTYAGPYDEEAEARGEDGYVSKWPGLEAFIKEWWGEDDSDEKVVQLGDLEGRALGAVRDALTGQTS